MYTKFVLRLRCNKNGNIRGVFAEHLKKSIEEIIEIPCDFKIRYLNKYQKIVDTHVAEGERHNFEFTIFDKNVAGLLISRLFKLRIQKFPVTAGDSEFVILDLFFKENMEDFDLPEYVSVVINTPYLMKWGDSFLVKFEKELFQRELYKNINQNRNISRMEFDSCFKKVDIDCLNVRKVGIKLNSFKVEGFMGEIIFRQSFESQEELDLFIDILAESCCRGVGVRKELGFGNMRFNV